MRLRTARIEKCLTLALTVMLLGAAETIGQERLVPKAPPDLTKRIDFERNAQYYLGPTGAKGWLYVNDHLMTDQARQILITEVQEGSPADGLLQVGDVILGAAGERFDSDARKCFGRAILEAEKNENKGILKLIRWRPVEDAATRQGKEQVVELQLRVMGAYSDTSPYNCPKSKKILEEALKVLVKQDGWGKLGVKTLAFLATGQDEYIKRVRDFLHKEKWAGPEMKISVESGGLVAWGAGYHGVILTEYYLATGDKYVLPAIREHAVKIAMGQSNGGTWGHGFAWTSQNDGRLHGRLGGYGALNQAGLPCFVTLILAKECGVEHPEIDDAIVRADRFFSQFVGNGSIGYGFHRPDLEITANGRNGMSGNGKNAIAAVAFSLLERREHTQFFSKLTASLYNTCEYGHSGNSYSYFWDPLGANCGGPKAAAAFLKELRWYYALTRRADGSFVNQPLGGYYGGGVLDPTVAQVLIATLPRRAIYLTGKEQDKSLWFGDKEVAQAVDAGRWRLADTHQMNVRELIDRLDNWSPIAREWIAKALAKKEGDFTGRLIELLKSDKPEARAGACAALGYQGPRAAAAVPLVSKALTDDEEIVRIAASYALARIDKPARRAVPDMLRAVLAAQEEGLMHPTQQALAYSLGYASSRCAPLYFTGILPKWPEDGNPLEGLDRELLYPAVAKLMKDPSGRVRGCGAYPLKFFTREDTAAMAQAIYDLVKVSAPNYMMFDDLPRQYGLDLLARHRIEEGLDLCCETLEERWGKSVRFPHRMQTLREYAGNARPVLPWLREMRWKCRSGDQRQLIEDAIRAVEEDKNPRPLVSLHTLVDRRLAKDLSSASDDRRRVRLCRRLIKENAGDYFYRAAALRRLVSILGADAFADVSAALGQSNGVLHKTAVKLGAQLPGEAVTRRWVGQLGNARGEKLAGVLDVLAARGGAAVLAKVKDRLADKQQVVRVAAIGAIGALGGRKELPLLLDSLAKANSEPERASAEKAIVAACRSTEDPEQGITPVLDALAEAARAEAAREQETPAARCALLGILGQLGGQKALAALNAATADRDATVGKAAFDALATSADRRASNVLLELAENTSDAKTKNAALTAGLRRVITRPVSPGQKLSLLKRLMILDGYGRNASAALAELRWPPSVESLRFAQSCLDKQGVAEPAASVALAIAGQLDLDDPKQRNAAVEAIKKVAEVTKNETTAAAAKEFIEQHSR